MNIFVLDVDPKRAAQAHYDKHVVKMIVEYAQLLSTCHAELYSPFIDELYKPTHVNHPCSLWVRHGRDNYLWLWQLLKELCHEYTYRYGHVHATERMLLRLVSPPRKIKPGMTEFVQCVPDHYKRLSPVDAYRALYLGEKLRLAKYTKRQPPTWFVTATGSTVKEAS